MLARREPSDATPAEQDDSKAARGELPSPYPPPAAPPPCPRNALLKAAPAAAWREPGEVVPGSADPSRSPD